MIEDHCITEGHHKIDHCMIEDHCVIEGHRVIEDHCMSVND